MREEEGGEGGKERTKGMEEGHDMEGVRGRKDGRKSGEETGEE